MDTVDLSTGEQFFLLFYFLIVSLPALGLILICVLWLIFIVRRPLLGIVGLGFIICALMNRPLYTLVLIPLGVVTCVFACQGTKMPIWERLRASRRNALPRGLDDSEAGPSV